MAHGDGAKSAKKSLLFIEIQKLFPTVPLKEIKKMAEAVKKNVSGMDRGEIKAELLDLLPKTPKEVIKDIADSILEESGSEVTKIPSVRGGKFSEWFNSLTPEEFDKIWENSELRDTIEDRLRSPGGLHEWHMVSRAPVFKKWGLTAEDIAEMRTPIKDVKFKNPPGEHGGEGSTTAHNEILKIIDGSPDYESFVKGLRGWADKRLIGGAAALPGRLKG